MKEALLVIDVQNDVVKHAFNREKVILNIHSLVQKARLHQIPVIWIQHEDDELKHGSYGWQIVEALKPLTEEKRIYKTWSNAFIETPLKAVLAQ